jgi:ribosomal protein S18 acetylase RimI-like enzyme
MKEKLVKVVQLNSKELQQLKKLYEECLAVDGFASKIYWNIIVNRINTTPYEYLYYVDDKLVGYVGLMVFKYEEAELTPLVHPDFRRRGIFKKLHAEAAQHIKNMIIPAYLIPCDKRAEVAKIIVNKWKGVACHHEHKLCFNKDKWIKKTTDAGLKYRRAKQRDVPNMATLDNAAFGTDFSAMFKRLKESLNEDFRKIWVASYKGIDVAKIHVRRDLFENYIHDVCVMPSYQNKRFGTAFFQYILNELVANKTPNLVMDVKGGNTSALRLYEANGFEEMAYYTYYKFIL